MDSGSTMHPTGRYFMLPVAMLVFAFVRGSVLTMSIDGPVFSWAIVVRNVLWDAGTDRGDGAGGLARRTPQGSPRATPASTDG